MIDSESKNPISGADIYFKEHPDKKVQSDNQGRFIFDPITKWILILIGPSDFMPPHGDLLIEMAGSERLEKKLYGPREIEGEFELKRR
ncbi:hypothetical protein FO488_03450 [Geobacter sp. FeAm09]|uniref:hypothetical protein n=1 Tax=Geobacter sp. FeAm09 TaxID=2597769 RepID=UPI0011EC131D|nr:hypothetical protein [Geobacter sp. FeAm09]QEM67300.1 hypothetical protein FO488_03450 [Geobacter sp. FeAm09]